MGNQRDLIREAERARRIRDGLHDPQSVKAMTRYIADLECEQMKEDRSRPTRLPLHL